jgi:hypothetical protein
MRLVLRSLVATLLAAAGCTASDRTDTSTIAATTKSVSRSLDHFRFIGAHTSWREAIAKLGAPDGDIGSGIHIHVFHLGDNTDVLIGTADDQDILYVRHGQDALFERR